MGRLHITLTVFVSHPFFLPPSQSYDLIGGSTFPALRILSHTLYSIYTEDTSLQGSPLALLSSEFLCPTLPCVV